MEKGQDYHSEVLPPTPNNDETDSNCVNVDVMKTLSVCRDRVTSTIYYSNPLNLLVACFSENLVSYNLNNFRPLRTSSINDCNLINVMVKWNDSMFVVSCNDLSLRFFNVSDLSEVWGLKDCSNYHLLKLDQNFLFFHDTKRFLNILEYSTANKSVVCTYPINGLDFQSVPKLSKSQKNTFFINLSSDNDKSITRFQFEEQTKTIKRFQTYSDFPTGCAIRCFSTFRTNRSEVLLVLVGEGDGYSFHFFDTSSPKNKSIKVIYMKSTRSQSVYYSIHQKGIRNCLFYMNRYLLCGDSGGRLQILDVQVENHGENEFKCHMKRVCWKEIHEYYLNNISILPNCKEKEYSNQVDVVTSSYDGKIAFSGISNLRLFSKWEQQDLARRFLFVRDLVSESKVEGISSVELKISSSPVHLKIPKSFILLN